jgi:hypothetical protein
VITVEYDKKRFFFDRALVVNAVGRASAKNLSKAGSFIRTSARSSLRRRKRSSEPGQPPSVHTRDRVATLKNIWFVFDPMRRSVVVGPLKLNGSSLKGSNRPSVPALHELGGTAVVVKRGRKRRVKYAPRPFMGPALARERPKFEGIWADTVK